MTMPLTSPQPMRGGPCTTGTGRSRGEQTIFTENLRQYYGFQYTNTSDAELVLELGEITCREQAKWLKPRLEWIGDLLAHFISARLGMGNVPDPGDFDA
jgi:hypothetical protein